MRDEPSQDLERWLGFLPEYARLQIDLTTRVGELLALGVPDYRPAAIVERLRELLDKPDWLGVGTYGPTVEEYRNLFGVVERYERWCAELDSLGIPPSLQHDDVHDGNVFRTPEGGFAFLDWGDAVVGHPFGSLLIAQRVAAAHLEHNVGHNTPVTRQLDKLRDAYLEPWTEHYDRRVLRRAVVLALRAVRVSRFFTLHRAFRTATEAERAPYGEWINGWFHEILDVDQSTE